MGWEIGSDMVTAAVLCFATAYILVKIPSLYYYNFYKWFLLRLHSNICTIANCSQL